VHGQFAHLTQCCIVSVADLTRQTQRYTDKITGQRFTPDREKPQTETQTSNCCSCFQSWNSERKCVGLHAPHTLDQNLKVENMNKGLMSVSPSVSLSGVSLTGVGCLVFLTVCLCVCLVPLSECAWLKLTPAQSHTTSTRAP